MYDLVIFDLDGTLIDSVGDITDALNRTFDRQFQDAEVAGWVGAGVEELLRRAGLCQAGDDVAALARRYRASYAEAPVRHTRPYLRVKETLRALGCTKAIATNKPGALSRSIVAALGLAAEFQVVLGEDDVGRRKPDPLIVDLIRGRVGTPRGRTLFVGDSLIDAATADAAGVPLCLVTYGYADPAAIRARAAAHHIDRFDALLSIVGGAVAQ